MKAAKKQPELQETKSAKRLYAVPVKKSVEVPYIKPAAPKKIPTYHIGGKNGNST